MSERHSAECLLDEKTERVAGEVGHDIQRLALIPRSVVEECPAEVLRTFTVPLKLLDRRHLEVQVHLHRNLLGWPSRRRGVLLFLETQDTVSLVVKEDQPVGIAFAADGGELLAGAIPQAEQLPVELGEAPAVLGIDCSRAFLCSLLDVSRCISRALREPTSEPKTATTPATIAA